MTKNIYTLIVDLYGHVAERTILSYIGRYNMVQFDLGHTTNVGQSAS